MALQRLLTMSLRNAWILLCCLVPLTAWAQNLSPQTPQVPMIIELVDADAIREIIAVTPQPWQALYIRWYTTILQRQQARQAELFKQQEAK
jgi:hypothetical protein